MPIYEFTCTECQNDFELLVRGSRWEDEISCPRCGHARSEHFIKQMSAPSVASSESGAGEFPSCSGNPSSCYRCHGAN